MLCALMSYALVPGFAPIGTTYALSAISRWIWLTNSRRFFSSSSDHCVLISVSSSGSLIRWELRGPVEAYQVSTGRRKGGAVGDRRR